MTSSPSPLLYYLAAGVLAAGTPAAIYVAQQGRREAARRLQAKDFEVKKEALTQEKDLAVLREAAIDAGVDPDAVIAGYEALRDGQVTLEDVVIKAKEMGG